MSVRKREKKEKTRKSYIIRVIENNNNKRIHVVLFILELILATILDILRIIKNALITLLIIGLICGAIATLIVFFKTKPYIKEASNIVENSDYSDFKISSSSYIYDSDGNVLAKLTADKDSTYLKYKDIPAEVIDAFVAVEDRTFWDNPGIDIKGIVRVLYNYVATSGEEAHGASTITQQLSRNIYLTHEVSIERKLKEIFISLGLTKKYTKQEIMEFYVNDICYANAFYGIQAASNGYFAKNVDELTLSQIAYLCAIPNSPEYYNPYKHPERAIKRRDKILKDMLNMGYITESDYKEAIKEEISIEKPTYEFNDYMTTYSVDCAVRYLMKLDKFEFRYKFDDMQDYKEYYSSYDEYYANAKNKLYTGGYKIYTTLDSDTQYKLQEILDNTLAFDDEIDDSTGIYALQGAITAYDNNSGKVIAVIGGRTQEEEYQTYSLNRAYQAYRQPGSTIKPLVVYTVALMNGYNPSSTVYNIDVSKAKEKGVDAQDLTGESMTLRSALEQSKNGVAWQLFDKFGANSCMSYLNEMQFSKICPDDYYNSSSLGGLTYGVTTVEMAAAYATLENHGEYREATCLKSILDRDGNEIYEESDTKQVYGARASDTMVDMMTGVLKRGTASKLGWSSKTKMAAAAKTGTTNNNKDGWLCGFTPYYTVAVWVGYDTPRTLSNLYGATYPGNIWKESMLELIDGKTVIDEFEKADYSKYGEEEEFSMADDLPEYAYDEYLAGRDDSEELSDGYTVYDYRKDRVIGESVDAIINKMNNLDKNSESYYTELASLYASGNEIIDSIYSINYTNEKKQLLDSTYNSLKN